jgi:D-alanine-D-alanine ligase
MSRSSRVVVLHDASSQRVGIGKRPDELDAFEQAQSVAQALGDLGHQVERVPFEFDPLRVRAALRQASPLRVFNLVESVDGDAALNHLAPAWLEHWGFTYTGCSALAHLASTDKLVAKERLRSVGIPTPAWYAQGRGPKDLEAERVIIKPIREDASIDIDHASVVGHPGHEALERLLESRSGAAGRPLFAEAYIEGREFNLALVGERESPILLPPAEILFLGYEERHQPKVVGYAAKWLPDSYEYAHTVRRYAFDPVDHALLAELSNLAQECWCHFGLGGYARIDYRVDTRGQVWVLEVNPNPCLSPDAGLAGAAAAYGWSYRELIARILAAA